MATQAIFSKTGFYLIEPDDTGAPVSLTPGVWYVKAQPHKATFTHVCSPIRLGAVDSNGNSRQNAARTLHILAPDEKWNDYRMLMRFVGMGRKWYLREIISRGASIYNRKLLRRYLVEGVI